MTEKYASLNCTLDKVLNEAGKNDLPDLVGIGERFVSSARLKLSMPTVQTNFHHDGDCLIGAKETAELIGMSQSWVEKHTRVLPTRVSVLGNPRWHKSDIERWIRTRPAYGKSS